MTKAFDSLKHAVGEWLRSQGDDIAHIEMYSEGAAGSCRFISRQQRDLFAKWSDEPVDGMYQAEKLGLMALAAQQSALMIPEVHLCAPAFIVIDHITAQPANDRHWQLLGEGLARLHGEVSGEFGFETDTWCGRTRQGNRKMSDGFLFFAEQRLLPLTQAARDAGLLERRDTRAVENLCAQLPSLLPRQPARLLHGDLWHGNVLFAQSGRPALIDPAAYWGWAEADLAMTTLFGGFDAAFYSEYENHSDVDRQWRTRADIYNLYHLLNHLVLFGSGYLGAVRRITQKF
jgi:protein-ribulosamine 3-kinase